MSLESRDSYDVTFEMLCYFADMCDPGVWKCCYIKKNKHIFVAVFIKVSLFLGKRWLVIKVLLCS